MNKDFSKVADDEAIKAAEAALVANGVAVHVVENGAAAKAKALEIIPEGAEIMTMTSMTMEAIGLAKELNESGRFASVRAAFKTMDPKSREKKKLGAAPEWAVGSVHAVTMNGHVLVASNTGSQLPAYAYGADRVVWVVGGQKIVKDTQEGLKRIYEHSLPLEDARARKVYGEPSAVNNILIINAAKTPGRLTLILVKETLGF